MESCKMATVFLLVTVLALMMPHLSLSRPLRRDRRDDSDEVECSDSRDNDSDDDSSEEQRPCTTQAPPTTPTTTRATTTNMATTPSQATPTTATPTTATPTTAAPQQTDEMTVTMTAPPTTPKRGDIP